MSAKLLVLNHEYPPLGGGAAYACESIIDEWKKLGHVVDVLTTTDGAKFSDYSVQKGTRVWRVFGKRNGPLDNKALWTSLSFVTLGLWRAIILHRKHRYDQIVCFFTIPAGFNGYILKLLFGVPYTVFLNGSDIPGYNPEIAKSMKILTPLIRCLWRNAKCVFSVTNGMKILAKAVSPDIDFPVVNYGFSPQVFFPRLGPKMEDSQIKVVTVARLVQRKGIQDLIQAVKILKVSGRLPANVGFEISGGGNYRKTLERLVFDCGLQGEILFKGSISADAIPEVYRGADLFVLPSLTEGFGLVLAEAMSCGLPVVATNVGGIPEVVTDERNGVLVPPASPELLADAIDLLLRNPALREKYSKTNPGDAREKFAWENLAPKHLKEMGL